ncbi:MAG: mechanosensitive ion channel family protein [Bilifractor sp.]
MEEFINSLINTGTNAGKNIILAIIVFFVGRFVIKKLLPLVDKLRIFEKSDPSVRSFARNFLNIVLYIILIISVISILGVPMASMVTVLASCGVAIGLALQGALSNIAGGLMILVFRPFNVGDYILALDAEGTVMEMTMFYTIVNSADNKKITIPNGQLMNANVINYTAEKTRRIELLFYCGRGEDVRGVRDIILRAVGQTQDILQDPAPFVQLSGAANESLEFTMRVWVRTETYWDVYYVLMENVMTALQDAGISNPAIHYVEDTKLPVSGVQGQKTHAKAE